MNFHATWFEWIFLCVGAGAMLTSIMTWRDAVMDGLYLSAAGKNDVRKMVADQNVRQESYRLGTSTVMLFVSIAFVLLEPPPPNYYELPQSLIGLIGWTSIAGVQVLNSLMDKSMRRRFSQIYDSPNPTNPQTGQRANSAQPADDDPSHEGSYGDDVRGIDRNHQPATSALAAAVATGAPVPVAVVAEPVHVVVDNVPLETKVLDTKVNSKRDH